MHSHKNHQRAEKTIIHLISLFALSGLLLITSCGKKDEPGVTTELSAKSRLLGKWRVESLLLNEKETVEKCEGENYEFKADDKVTYAYKSCSTGAEIKEDYGYVVSADGKTFTINLVTPPNTLFDTPRTILELTETTLRFTYKNPNGTYKGVFKK
jgi:Lipocalin-like domain